MTIYTVISVDELDMEPIDYNIAGSYVRRGDALRECAKYILERAGMRCDLEHMLLHDENHKDFPRRGKKKRLEYLVDRLGGDSCYCIYCEGYGSFHFSVFENEAKGEVFSLVTWGDSDIEDPAFTTPTGESYDSEDSAVESAESYAFELLMEYKYKSDKAARNEARRIGRTLRKDGEARLDLDDGAAVHWKLDHRPLP